MRYSKFMFLLVSCTLLLLLTTLLPVVSSAQVASERHTQASTRLHFRRGRHHIVVLGGVGNKNPTPHDYVFTARAGQKLDIRLKALQLPGQKAGDTVAVLYHITFPSGKQYGMKGYEPFDGRLSQTGAYHITISINQMATNAEQGRYRLDLTQS